MRHIAHVHRDRVALQASISRRVLISNLSFITSVSRWRHRHCRLRTFLIEISQCCSCSSWDYASVEFDGL